MEGMVCVKMGSWEGLDMRLPWMAAEKWIWMWEGWLSIRGGIAMAVFRWGLVQESFNIATASFYIYQRMGRLEARCAKL